MAKKGVVIFDGEDMFINPKKAIYSKTRGEARNASFMSARGDDSPGEEESPSDDGNMGKERIMREGTSGGGSQAPSAPPAKAPPIVDEPIAQQIQAPAEKKTTVEPDTILIKSPIAEIPTIVVPPILPPNYIAPTPDVPTRPTPPQRPGSPERTDPVSGIRYKGDEPEPGATPIFTIDDGTPAKPVIDTPRYVAPVPVLPGTPTIITPPAAKIIGDPLGGGGSPILGRDPEVPKDSCPTGFILNTDTGKCVPTPGADPCAGFPKPQLARPRAGFKWVRKADCSYELVDDGTGEGASDEILTPATTSSTTTTTTKPADKVDENCPNSIPRQIGGVGCPSGYEPCPSDLSKCIPIGASPTTSTTTTTTTKKSKNCNPPIYAAPKYYKWVDKGNCTFELAVDDTQIKDAAPAPVLPAAAGQPIININLPTGGLGTVPTTSTIVQTTTLAKPSGGGSGGGGGTPFPEEPAPVVEEAPKKNYFWWYVGGALAVYLLIKRKKSQ